MTSTTIKVSTETRDRLKAQARASQVSLGEHLNRLADAADREARMIALRHAVASTEATSYAAEDEAWETTELTDAPDD